MMVRLQRMMAGAGLLAAILGAVAVMAAVPEDYRKAGSWLDTIKDSCVARDKALLERTAAVVKPAPNQVVSPILRGKDEAHLLTMDVSGLEYLSLLVSDGGDGIGLDHAVWANARLMTADGKEVWMEELKPDTAEVGCFSFIAAAKEITIGEKTYQHQLFAHAPSKACYRLDPARKFKTFEAYVGIDKKAGGRLGPVHGQQPENQEG